MLKHFTDQMDRTVTVNFPPKRIVSIVPSQTELLYDIGLNHEVVGQTLFCIHPQEMHQVKPRVGGTKKLNFKKIAELNPDLIIGNKEENEQSQIEELMKHYPVWMSDIQTLGDALDMIVKVGDLVDRKKKSEVIALQINESFTLLNSSPTSVSVAYFIWRNPWMVAGHDTFINNILQRCGLKNIFENETSRYPEITSKQIQTLNPELILLSSEPYPFKQKHIDDLKEISPDSKIILVDGELFSWYGSRLLKSAHYLQLLLQNIHL